MHLMSRVGEDYLLNKLSNRSVFQIEKSKKQTIENIKEMGIDYWGIKDQKELRSVIKEIDDIDPLSSEETFFREVQSIIPEIDWEFIETIKDYPYGAVIVVEMFMKYLQPKIKREL